MAGWQFDIGAVRVFLVDQHWVAFDNQANLVVNPGFDIIFKELEFDPVLEGE